MTKSRSKTDDATPSPTENQAIEMANTIRRRRLEMGIPGSEMAAALGIERPAYYYLERTFSARAQERYLDLINAKLFPNQGKTATNTTTARQLFLRRKELKITAKDMAVELGIYPALLRTWENRIPANLSQNVAENWERKLGMPVGSIKAGLSGAGQAPIVGKAIAPTAVTVEEEIRQMAELVSQDGRANTRSRNVEIFCRRFGLYGRAETILEQISFHFGVTKQRTQQLIESMLTKAKGFDQTSAVKTMQLLATIKAETPMLLEEADVRHRGAIGGVLSLRSITAWVEEIWGNPPVSVVPNRNSERNRDLLIANGLGQLELINEFRDVAVRMISRTGAAHIYAVLGAMGEKCNLPLDMARRMVVLFDNASYLSDDNSWFWFGEVYPKNNHFLVAVRKILSCHPAGYTIGIEDLLAGTSRMLNGQTTGALVEMPPAVALTICQKLGDWLRVSDRARSVSAVATIAPEETLNAIERYALTVLRDKASLPRKQFVTDGIAAGLDSPRLYAAINSSPILRPLANDGIALR